MGRTTGRTADGGFTMVEVLVALALVTTVMASLGTYFVSSIKTSRKQGQIQTAERLIQTAMEQARGYGGPTLLYGRGQCGSCVNVSPYDGGYLLNTQRWDAAVTGQTPTVPLPNAAEVIGLNNIYYYRYWLLGKCWVNTDGSCGTTVRPVEMVRLVVGITWAEPSCPGSFCIRAGSTLFSNNPADPVFGP